MPSSITPKGRKRGSSFTTTLDKISAVGKKWARCRKCGFSKYRKNVVMFKGNADSGVVLIGEAPGKEEDRIGIPFVGSAGKVLDGGLKLAHMTLNDCGVVNIMACRPCLVYDGPNDTPDRDETRNCLPRLETLLNILKPSIVVLLGRIAQDAVLGKRPEFSRLHYRGVTICLCLHPAALIYDVKRRDEWKKFWREFRSLRKLWGVRRDVVWSLPLKRRG